MKSIFFKKKLPPADINLDDNPLAIKRRVDLLSSLSVLKNKLAKLNSVAQQSSHFFQDDVDIVIKILELLINLKKLTTAFCNKADLFSIYKAGQFTEDENLFLKNQLSSLIADFKKIIPILNHDRFKSTPEISSFYLLLGQLIESQCSKIHEMGYHPPEVKRLNR